MTLSLDERAGKCYHKLMKTIDEVLQAHPFRAIGEQNPKINS